VLNRHRCRTSLDNPVSLALEKVRGGLCEEKQLCNARILREAFELASHVPSEPPASLIGGDDHRAQQSGRAEMLQRAGGDDLTGMAEYNELRSR